MTEMNKHYDPKAIEHRWYPWWEEKGLFHGDVKAGGESYCIVMPPPNVTGVLHMGHALNHTIQDVLIRWKRMQGYNVSWVPGVDHAGIATQNVVERKIREEGSDRHEMGREEFLERVWQWKKEYGATITRQLRKIGASCDWERERFTMDEGLSRAVLEVFVQLYDKGLVYRGNYIVNWCPRCATALSDEESEHKETDGHLYHIRYPIKGGKKKDFVVVATTRPETMLGDVAVAVNPRDERFREMLEKTLELPVVGRELRIIEDDFVDPEFGTGLVKVTPAHDPNDFDIGRRHALDPINVMHEDGTMNDNAGPYAGMDRFDCRKKLVEDLSQAGYLENVEDHKHAVGHCYRCQTVVEPRLSLQWFVKMKPLARPAINVVRNGDVRFVPERWNKVYLEWMEHIRDWCISRQIWWGHRIPVFFCDACNHEWAEIEVPTACPECNEEDVRQDEDVLDTWFSSWLWPFSVFGWPDQHADLKFYYPTNSLSTASEILFFWVARMIMAGLEFTGEIPFEEVYIHGTVRDDKNRKMSKSLGNSIDPLDIVETYSADALRFSLIMLTATGQDVYISNEKFEIGRNFGTKIWNAARFMQMHSEAKFPEIAEPRFETELLGSDDKHILAKLHETIEICDENLRRFRFNDYAKALYDFLWHTYCDWYVEYSKNVFQSDDDGHKEQVRTVMHYVFSHALRLLHPLMPFVTEELWDAMGYNREHASIMKAPWPVARDEDEMSEWGVTRALANYVDAKHDLIRVGRTLRADYGLKPNQAVDYIVRPPRDKDAKRLQSDSASLRTLLRAENVTIDCDFVPPSAMPSGLSQLGAIYMPLGGLVDVDAELQRLTGQIDKVGGDLKGVNKKLDNMNFVSRAPAHVVEQQKSRKKDLLEKHEKLQKLIDTLAEQCT